MNASAGDPTDGDSLNCDSPDRRYKTCMILYSADVPWRPFGIFLGLLADGRSIGWIFDSDFGGEGGVGVYSTHIGLLGRFLGKKNTMLYAGIGILGKESWVSDDKSYFVPPKASFHTTFGFLFRLKCLGFQLGVEGLPVGCSLGLGFVFRSW